MKYILAVVGVVIVIIFVIVLLAGGGNNSSTTDPNRGLKLQDYTNNTNAYARIVMQGTINAPENHRIIQITVSPNERKFQVIQGYQGNVIKEQIFSNDTDSYSDFLAALNRAGYTSRRNLRNDNSQSICPTGTRNNYMFVDNGNTLQNTWSASCTTGSFQGNSTLTQTLFQAQIPGYSKLTSGVSLTSILQQASLPIL